MRKFAVSVVAVMLFAGLVSMAGEHEAMKGKTHELTVTIVSVDMEKGTITFKTDDGEKTAPVMKEAKAHMDEVKAGDTVVLTCQDTEDGSHEGVVKIKAAKE